MTDPDMPMTGPDKGTWLVHDLLGIAKDNPLNLIRLVIFAVMMAIAAPFLWIAIWVVPEEE